MSTKLRGKKFADYMLKQMKRELAAAAKLYPTRKGQIAWLKTQGIFWK